ncbi:recombinase family protein [Alteraurantiacibacter buctensis]|uniref:Recombinase family protein n=1 Tax=Alteraurantiacibacter buctensis TaxID=1503981 RepID=A0A844YTB1_9SPHN|nr:recombinase family protein [Alteraurantiacibacter buctensis]MXO70256.1 recombinase family protein [Alteraurantiacibacter buctensis]
MVIKWLDTNEPELPSEPPRQRAAEYVRMSTEHQKYSTDNQAAAIRRYAEQRNYEIVRTYADQGKSGLTIGGRLALQQLLDDVESGQADFTALLVYDVSRWGRFQDPDEAASYELRCRRAGVQVHYCIEQFENDGSIGSSIIKTVKRAMAGEYSRELSVKVFAGQANLIRLGYRQGGTAGFGLRRMLVDQAGREKGQLARLEHKSITTDRVILIPGPPEEIEVVRNVYRMFVEQGRSEREIADSLNARGLETDLGRPWSRGSVHQLLINEKYIGNNVWAKTSCKLKGEHVRNAPEEWIRAVGVFSGIISVELFESAQTIIRQRSERLSNEDMLLLLAQILERNGCLSGLIIDEADNCPSSSSFRTRFGSLLRAYTLVGFTPDHDYRYLETNRALRAMHPGIVQSVISGIERAGGRVSRDPATDLLTINREFTTSLVIVRCFQTSGGSKRWKIRLDTKLRPDLTLAIRMDSSNTQPRDYYLLPRIDMREAILRLAECNGLSLDAYRFDSLEPYYHMAVRANFREAA